MSGNAVEYIVTIDGVSFEDSVQVTVTMQGWPRTGVANGETYLEAFDLAMADLDDQVELDAEAGHNYMVP